MNADRARVASRQCSGTGVGVDDEVGRVRPVTVTEIEPEVLWPLLVTANDWLAEFWPTTTEP
jgi:hypothetical protein